MRPIINVEFDAKHSCSGQYRLLGASAEYTVMLTEYLDEVSDGPEYEVDTQFLPKRRFYSFDAADAYAKADLYELAQNVLSQ